MQYRRGRVDPIDLLKDSIINKKPIKQKERNSEFRLVFDNNIELKFSTETAWVGKSNKYYSLGDLWVFLDSHHLQGLNNKDYIKRTIDNKVVMVGKTDQNDILEYFTGHVDYTECINLEKKTQLLQQRNRGDELDSTNKRVRIENEPFERDFNLKVIDEIMRFDKPITTKNKQLRVPDRQFDYVLDVAKKIFSSGQQPPSLDRGIPSVDRIKMPHLNPHMRHPTYLAHFLESKDRPIIIVPQIYDAGNICLKNAKQFLEDGTYLDATNIKFLSETRNVDIKGPMKASNCELTFMLTDIISDKLKWNNVMCAFVRGTNSELKTFQSSREASEGGKKQVSEVTPQDPAQVFKNIRVYNLKFEDEKEKDTVKQWGAKVLELHRSKRHQDAAVVARFWEDLEQHLLRSR